MSRGPKRQERCRAGLHLMTIGNRRIKSYVDAAGITRGLSNGCRRCNAARQVARNLAAKLGYASDGGATVSLFDGQLLTEAEIAARMLCACEHVRGDHLDGEACLRCRQTTVNRPCRRYRPKPLEAPRHA